MPKRKRFKAFKKILFLIFILIIGGISTFLFYIGFTSIISYFPILNKIENEEVLSAAGKSTTVNELEQILSEKNIIMDELYESSKSALIIGKIKEGPGVFFATSKEATFQVNSLQLVLSRLTIDNKKPTLIDMRFDQVIVKF